MVVSITKRSHRGGRTLAFAAEIEGNRMMEFQEMIWQLEPSTERFREMPTQMHRNALRAMICILMGFAAISGHGLRAQSSAPDLREAAIASFEAVCDGWSVDELLLRDELRTKYVESIRDRVLGLEEDRAFEILLAARKAGKIAIKATQRDQRSTLPVQVVSELAARGMYDRHRAHIDDVLTSTRLLAEFDAEVQAIAPNADRYLARKAALQLRKSRRLRPELVVRAGDWDVAVSSFVASEIRDDLKKIPTTPGIYVFRDDTGYLYIGQSNNLRERLKKHLDESDRAALAAYLKSKSTGKVWLDLHVFGENSPGRQTEPRKAYESELIRSRLPRLNVAP